MFHKENSSFLLQGRSGGGGGNTTTLKKGKDIPVRKSDRRKLWQAAVDFFLCSGDEEDENHVMSFEEEEEAREEKEVNPNSSTSLLAQQKKILHDAFLKGSLVKRSLKQSSSSPYRNADLFFRSSSNSTVDPSISQQQGDDHDDDAEDSWPYRYSTQCIWIQLEPQQAPQERNHPSAIVQIPGLALLSVLQLQPQLQHSSNIMETRKMSMGMPAIVTVPSAASRFLCRGADLMRPGILSIQYDHRRKNHHPKSTHSSQSITDTPIVVAAIQVQRNPQPMAVGILHPDLCICKDNDHDDETQASTYGPGSRGVGVHIIHCYGDDLWRNQHSQLDARYHPTYASSSSVSRVHDTTSRSILFTNAIGGGALYEDGNYGNVGFLDGQKVVSIIPKNDNHGDSEGITTTAAMAVADDDDDDESWKDVLENETGGISTGRFESAEDAQKHTNDTTITESPTQTNAAETSEPTETEIPPSQDEILHDAVCRALVSLHLKRDFPMAMSTFYAQHVLNSRREGETIQLKQTRYKRFGPYVAEQVERGLFTVDGTQNDALSILKGYDPRHPDLKEYQRERKESSTEKTDTSQKRMVIADLYCVPNHFISKLRLDPDVVKAVNASSVERRNTGMLTLKEVRAILESYIVRENMVDPNQPAKILLDGPLTDVLYKAKKSTTPDFIFPTTLLRGDLLKQWVDLQEPAYALVELPGNVVLKLGRGKAPLVQIIVTRRQSRKFETRVLGVELYGIDPNSFAKDVAHRFACSSSVTPSESKSGLDEILFQGNLADELEALLLSDDSLTDHGGAKNSPYRLPKNGVEVILRKGVPARKNQSKKKTSKKQ